MTSRELFEEWFSNDVVGAEMAFPDFEDGEYIAGEVYDDQLYIMLQAMWMAWKASRSEIEIMMPEPFQMANSTSGLSYYYEKEVDDALRQAGIKVKDC